MDEVETVPTRRFDPAPSSHILTPAGSREWVQGDAQVLAGLGREEIPVTFVDSRDRPAPAVGEITALAAPEDGGSQDVGG